MRAITRNTSMDVWSQKSKDPGVFTHVTDLNTDKRTAIMTCPGCGNIESLRDHHIDDDGVVTPSVECSYNHCEFHDEVKLIGWDKIHWNVSSKRKEVK